MLGFRTRRPPPFGGVHINDDKDIQVHRPVEASRRGLYSEGRLLLRDLIFALMVAALVVVFIVQPVKVEGTSMLPRLHDGERIFVNKLIYYDEYSWAPKVDRGDIVVRMLPPVNTPCHACPDSHRPRFAGQRVRGGITPTSVIIE